MSTLAKPFCVYSMKSHLSLICPMSGSQYAQNNEFSLKSLHCPVHLQPPHGFQNIHFLSLSFKSSHLPWQVGGYQSTVTLPFHIPRLGWALQPSVKHKVPVTKHRGTRYHSKSFHSRLTVGLERAAMTQETGLRAALLLSPTAKGFQLGSCEISTFSPKPCWKQLVLF